MSKPSPSSTSNEAVAVMGLFCLSKKAESSSKKEAEEETVKKAAAHQETTGASVCDITTQDTSKERKVKTNDMTITPDQEKNICVVVGPTTIPRTNDILSGRGNGANQHTGNIYFRNLIASYKRKYVLSDPVIKKQITHQVLSVIESRNPPGRFLKQDSDTGDWKGVDRDTALRKTAQALREKAPLLKKKVLEEAERKDKIVESLKRKSLECSPPMGKDKKHRQLPPSLMRNTMMKPPRSSLNPIGDGAAHADPNSSQNGALHNRDILSSDGHYLLQQQLQQNATHQPHLPTPALFQNVPSMHAQHQPLTQLNLVPTRMPNSNLILNELLQNNGIMSAAIDNHSGNNGLSFLRQHPATNGTDETLMKLLAPQDQQSQSSGFMPFTFNYKEMTISSHTENSSNDQKKLSRAAKAKRAKEICIEKSAEMLENIVMIASTSVDLTALFLIVSMSAQAFNSPSFSKHELKPRNHDVIINASDVPNHPGNLMLAEAIQTYRSDYLHSGYSNQMKHEIVQLLLSSITNKDKNTKTTSSKKDARFLTREKTGKSSNKAEWKILPEKEIFSLVKSLFEQACSFILNPDANDVLFGSDDRSRLSPGNIFFKSIIRRCKPLFLESPPEKKMQYATEIVGFVTSRPGRFLGYIENMGMWIPLPFESAIEQTQEQLDDNTEELIVQLHSPRNNAASLPPNLIFQDVAQQFQHAGIPQNPQLYGNAAAGNPLTSLTAAGIAGVTPLTLQGQWHIDTTRNGPPAYT